MLKSIWKVIRRFLITSVIADVVCLIWQQIEFNVYGYLQYSASDDIFMFIVIPIIYMIVARFEKN